MEKAIAGIKAMLRDAEEDLKRQLANVASAANDAESHYSDLADQLLHWQTQAEELQDAKRALEKERRALAAKLQEKEQAPEEERRRAERRAIAAQLEVLEEKDRALEGERRALAAQRGESDRALGEERRALAAQLEERDRALEGERRALAAQRGENDRALDEERRALAAQLAEKGRALEGERRALAAQRGENDRALDEGRRALLAALDEERRALATQLEEKDRALDEERRAFAAQLKEKDRALEEEKRALASQLEEKDRALDEGRRTLATQLEEKDRALEAERRAHAAQLEEKDLVFEVDLHEERRALAAQLAEKDRALEEERRALAAQLHERDRALEEVRRAVAAQLEEKDCVFEVERHEERRALAAQFEEKERALEAERRALATQTSAQGVHNVVGQGVTWQYCVKNQWIEMPSECALELTRRYQAGTASSSSGGDAMSPFSCQSGTERYEFNLRAMQQKNLKTLTQRQIRCVVHCPKHWTRCRSLDAIQNASATLTRTVELKGFRSAGRDGVYVESPYDSHGGKALWWKHNGSRYIQWNSQQLAWQMCSVGGDYLQRRNGSGVFDAETQEDPDHGGSWVERVEQADGQIVDEPVTVQSTAPAPANPMSPFMNIVVELLDKPTREKFRGLLVDTAVHQQPCAAVQGRCAGFKHTLKIVRVLRVENWHLLAKYRSHVHHMKQDMEKYGIRPAAVEPRSPHTLDETFTYYGGGDADVNECFLFHGTSSQVAASIAQEGFDFRLARPGYYGRGTYFASQSCKSFQYTDGGGDELRTIIVSRVALGDVMYAPKVDKQRGRPEVRDGTPRCYDSLVANPGPMPGHQHGQQTHQEFVIFENFQAYPEFLVQFTCSV